MSDRTTPLLHGALAARGLLAAGLASVCLLGCRWRPDPIEDELLPFPRIDELREIRPLELTPAEAATTEPRTADNDGHPTPPADVRLTLAECRVQALAGNLALRAQLVTPEVAAEGVTEAEAAFESVFFADAGYSRTDSPSATALAGTEVQSLSLTPGVRIPLRTGGTIQFDLPMTSVETDNAFATLNPSYTTDLRVTVQQPLLRGAGARTNTYAIRLARLEGRKSEALTRLEVIRVLAAVDRVYWELYAARRELDVRRQEHELATTQLQQARRLVSAGSKPEVEVMRASLGVAERLEAIILADNRVRERERDLKRLLQKQGLGMESPTVLVPASEPDVLRYDLDPVRLADMAVENRMQLLDLELRIAREALTADHHRNETLPLVALAYTYNANGLGGDWGDAFDLLFEKEFEDDQFGLRVEVPLGNRGARSRLRQSLLRRVQLLAQRDERVSLIRQEVHNAVDRLSAAWQQVMVSRPRITHAERLVEAEQRQFEQGLRTTTDVLEARARLAAARLAEIRALTGYQVAQVDVAVATGTLLAADRIRWEPSPPVSLSGE